MATCTECGSDIASNSAFCTFCGNAQQIEPVPATTDDVGSDEAPALVETADAQGEAVAEATNKPSKKKRSKAEVEIPKDIAPSTEQAGSVDEEKSIASDPDFSQTLPYTSMDFPEKLDLLARETEPKNKGEDKIEVDDIVTPVESTAKESISSADEKVASASEEPGSEVVPDSEAKSVDGPAEEDARTFTSPNIAGDDTDGKKSSKLKPLEEGTLLNGRYQIVRKIGGGGMGAVYLANDLNLGGVLRAVKEMVQAHIEESQQEKAINDFKRESMLLSSLEHPSIPTIYDYFFDEKESRFYLVMKYIAGGDLSGRLRAKPEGRIEEVTVTEWAIQIADVLDYLHKHEPPIVYRDLKPSNIMIDGKTSRAMLIDFGIARWINKEEKGVTAVGTMGYAPPELFSGNVEPRSDIYSLGSTMFHLMTGADPQNNPLLIFDFNKNPRPRQISSQLTDQMEQILMRSVEYNAEMRFASAAELRDVLIAHLENLKKGAVTFGVVDTASDVHSFSNLPVFCGFCGQKIVATDQFCPFCGAQQPLAQKSSGFQKGPVFAAPRQTAKLAIVGTTELERSEFNLDKDVNLLGRRDPLSNIFPEVDLSKYDPQTKISRKHARIRRENDGFVLEDLGSSNGTTLVTSDNRSTKLLPHHPQILTNGDKITLGDTTLYFYVA